MLRRSFLKGLGATLFVAPSIVRAENLMKIKEYMPAVPEWCPAGWLPCDGREIKKKFYPELYANFTKLRFPLQLQEHQFFAPYNSYEPWPPTKRIERIISYKDMKRANGTIAKAGIIHDLLRDVG